MWQKKFNTKNLFLSEMHHHLIVMMADKETDVEFIN
jgi:hypothetical protein